MSRFHISKSGKPAQCKAVKGQCPLGNVDHFNTKQEANNFIAEKLEKEYTSITMSTVKNVVTTDNENNLDSVNMIEPDTMSADISRNYAHLSIAYNHMHNSSDVGNDLELYYYSSAQGRLELDRRIKQSSRYGAKEYQEILDKVNSSDYEPLNVEFNNMEKIIAKGNESYNRDFSRLDNNVDNRMNYNSNDRTSNEENVPMKHSLVNYSHDWLNKLSTDQQETVSTLTSGGFKILQATTMKDEEVAYNHHAFESYVDENEYYDKYAGDYDKADDEILKAKKNVAERLRKNMNNAFNNAPVLEKPIMTYRGTELDEMKDIIGLDENSNDKELWNKLANNEYSDTNINKDSRIGQIPVSSTVNPNTAKRFGGAVVLEIKRKTMTSPVNVSAWGSAETEVLTNPTNNYKIHNSYLDKEHNRMIVHLEENLDETK